MSVSSTQPQVLRTSRGDLPLHEYRPRLAGREWTALHTGAVLTHEDEARFLGVDRRRRCRPCSLSDELAATERAASA